MEKEEQKEKVMELLLRGFKMSITPLGVMLIRVSIFPPLQGNPVSRTGLANEWEETLLGCADSIEIKQGEK